MVTKKNLKSQITLRKKKNSQRGSKKRKKLKKRKNSFRGGMIQAAALGAAGILGAQATGITDRLKENVLDPAKRKLTQATETAKDVSTGFMNFFSSIRDNFRTQYDKTYEKIKGNEQYFIDGKSVLALCKQLNRDLIDDENFKKNIDSFKNTLIHILYFKNRDNHDNPFFFDILRYLANNRNALEHLIEKSGFKIDQILEIVDKNNSNCIHYCSLKGLIEPLDLILNNRDYLSDDMKQFSITSQNNKNLNPLHYALRSNHKDTPDIVDLLLKKDTNNSFQSEDTNFNDDNERYTTFLLKNKYNKKFDLTLRIMEILIDYNFQLPIGKDFTDTNSQQLFRNIKEIIQNKELQYTLQLSHLNDHSVNSYYCPQESININNNDGIELDDDIDVDDISDTSDIDEEGDAHKKLEKDITIYESIKDIEDIENNVLRKEKVDTIKVPAGESITLKRKEGDYQKIKYGPINGWVRRLELLKELN